MEWHLKYRPADFDQVVSQEQAVKTLQRMLKRGRVPHVLLICGPSGVGKTTLARILKKQLNCSDVDFHEINGASARGIETIRSIEERMVLSPMGGDRRIWLVDEAHKLSSDAQNAFLKILEEPPNHVHFILCTTDPDKIITTVRTRCCEVVLRSFTTDKMEALLREVADKEKVRVSDNVLEKIAQAANGSARRAMFLLEKVSGTKNEEEQLKEIAHDDTRKVAFDLVRALMWERPKWPQIAAIIKDLTEDDWERFRRLVLSIATTECLKAGKNAARAYLILDCFQETWFYTGKAGLVRACYEVVLTK